ncbi:MAG: murein biosynthesis integral membrane protein MurJ [Oscillospiraceae bacterium]|nr:murein biosynthesis integral membrane protein MurJ [Oscillospiraceae bacterium]
MKTTTKALSLVTVLMLVTRLLGFVREMVIAHSFGATYQTDAFNMAISIAFVVTMIISAGVATVIIPMYNHKKEEVSKEHADIFASNILWIFSFLYLVVSILGIVFAPTLVRIFAPSFDESAFALTVIIVRIMLVFTVAFNISNFLTAILQIYQKFTITVVAQFPFSLFTIFFVIFLTGQLGIYALVISYILFLVVQALMLIISARKVFKFARIFSFRNGDFGEVVKLSLPIYLSVGIWDINIIIDRILASGLPEGSITAINFAQRLRDLPVGVIAAAVWAVVFPLLAKQAANKEFDQLKATAVRFVKMLAFAFMPIVMISMFFPMDITRIVYERGEFGAAETLLTGNIFFFMAASMLFISCTTLLNNAFFSIKDTKTPLISGIVSVVFNIGLNIVLVRYMEAAGLALATTVASAVGFFVSFALFRRKFGAFGGLALAKNIGKCVIACTAMVPVLLLFELLRDRLPLLIFFAAASVVSLGVYALILYLLKADLFVEMTDRVFGTVKSKIKKN